MMTVKEVSKLAGVSVRTLRYYDNIGLLKASAYTDTGYRLYDEDALMKLQQILLFRELEFPLKEIMKIMGSPGYDQGLALEQQIELLRLKKERLQKLIDLARGIKLTGERTMDFSAFNRDKINDYSKRAGEIWGNTAEYKEFMEKSKARNAETEDRLGAGLMDIFTEFGLLVGSAPESAAAQDLVEKLQGYITENYYSCSKEILSGLGEMYAAGGEFTENIDRRGGKGTADFAAAAIKIYCKA